MKPAEKIFPAQKLEEFCISVLTKAGLSQDWSAILAQSLVYADLRGIQSHGVVRLETYMKRLEAGVMKPEAPIEIEMDKQAVALVNANNTFGQIAGKKAMTLAMDKAKEYGTGVVAVKNSNHFGIAAYYAMMALDEDMVGCVFTNASPAMAVYGTKTPLIGTNPISIAIPADEQFPIVLDMSTSVVARGKIRYAALTGHAIPMGWARDSDGKPTENAEAALKGTLEPVGGVKGSALSLIIDIICGILTDTVLTGGVRETTDMSGPTKTGHFFSALNISRFIDVKRFKTNVDQVIRNIKGLPAISEGQTYMPGEIEYLCSRRRMKDGIPLAEDVVELLNSIAVRHGVPPLLRDMPS
jgi:LDH2 family malate/lactate/ureidoglycolate dehydrogenase